MTGKFALPGFLLAFTAVIAAPESRPFEDRSAGSGISIVLRNGATGQKRLIETMTGGVAVLDFDNDALPDLYFVNGASGCNRLYRNKGNWRFEDVTAKAGVCGSGFGMAVSAADYDNDGFTDLLATSVDSVTLFHNRGDGTFEDVTRKSSVTASGWIVAGGWFDYNNDGLLDLFLVHYVHWDAAREPWCGDEAHQVRTYCHPRFYPSTSNQLFRNNGDGTFRDVSQEAGIATHKGKGMGVAFADYDHDGRTDVFVTNDALPNVLFHNDGNGRFREIAAEAGVSLNDDGKPVSSMGVDFRDIDNDGHEDLFVTALAAETFPFFRNMNGRNFMDRTYPTRLGALTSAYSGWGVGVFDFDNDGWKDIFAANGDVQDTTRQRNLLLWNRRGTWSATEQSVPAFHRGVAFADLDLDGRVDAVVTRLNETPLLLRNVAEPAGNWLRVQLVGRRSNGQGIGARVTITAGGSTQVNHATTSLGYASSSEAIVHFGVGSNKVIDRIDVEWPSGVWQTLERVRANQVLRIEEPETTPRP